MIDLSEKGVTLFQVYCQSQMPQAKLAFEKCRSLCRFTAARMVDLGFKSVGEYNAFMMGSGILRHFNSKFILITQWDGFIVNSAAWDDSFLAYDYIGAPTRNDSMNGGFCIRSRRLCELVPRILRKIPGNKLTEDLLICSTFRSEFERAGVRFAPESLAHRFAWEENERYPKYEGQFGIHIMPNRRTPEYMRSWIDGTAEAQT